MSNIDTTLYNTNINDDTYDPNTDVNNKEDRLFFTLLNKNVNYCSKSNIDNPYCNNYFTNADTKINNILNNEYNNAKSYVYSNPLDSVYNPIPDPSTVSCMPNIGKNRFKTMKGSYTYPVFKSHDPYIQNNFTNDIENIRKLKMNESKEFINKNNNDKILFTRLNNIYPEQYELKIITPCPNMPYRQTPELDTLWTNTTGCTTKLSDTLSKLNTTYDTLQYTENLNDITNLFLKYSRSNLLKTNAIKTISTADIETCYGAGNYITLTRYDFFDGGSNPILGAPLNNRLYPGVRYDNSAGNIRIMMNSGYEVWFTVGGEIKLSLPNKVTLDPIATGNGAKFLVMQYDGNLVMYNKDGGAVWNSSTFGNNGAYLNLSGLGDLEIFKSNGDRIKYLFNAAEWSAATLKKILK